MRQQHLTQGPLAVIQKTRDVGLRIVIGWAMIWLGIAPPAVAWGPAGHAVIGQLAESYLLQDDAGLQTLLQRFRTPQYLQRVRNALRQTSPPLPGKALRVFANWPDRHKREPGMLPDDARRHYVNLPHRQRYRRDRHCPHGRCSIETLLHQRAILANRRAPLSERAVALAWVTHLVGDIHQPLHAGKQDDRGGNLTCITWKGQPSRLININGNIRCSGANLHAVWDSGIIEAVTGFNRPNDATAFARRLQRSLRDVQAAEPPIFARTRTEWRRVVERWHTKTQSLILQERIYPPGNTIGRRYVQTHYRTIRLQLLRAAVRLGAMLHQALNP